MPIKIVHPEHGNAACGDWQLAEFRALGWKTAEEAAKAAADKAKADKAAADKAAGK